MITKQIVWFGRTAMLACDGRCDKAWGLNGRPRRYLSDADDDYVDEPDSALGTAPGPGATWIISEGSDMKPSAVPLGDGARMNKWCARECERSSLVEIPEALDIPDLEHPKPNMGWRR